MSIIVKAKPGESPDSVVRRFNKQMIANGPLTRAHRADRHVTESEHKQERMSELRRRKKRKKSIKRKMKKKNY